MADTYEEARDAISTLVQTTWDTVAPGAPMFYDNKSGDRPDEPTLFGRLKVQFVGGSRASLGPSSSGVRFRRNGTVFVQIFEVAGEGTVNFSAVGQALVAAIEDAGAVDNVWFRDVGMREIGLEDDKVYYQVNVEAFFTFDRVT